MIKRSKHILSILVFVLVSFCFGACGNAPIFDENKDNTLMTKRPKTGVADNKLAHVRKVLETIYNFNGVKSHKI